MPKIMMITDKTGGKIKFTKPSKIAIEAINIGNR
jgi:hypothetical protein